MENATSIITHSFLLKVNACFKLVKDTWELVSDFLYKEPAYQGRQSIIICIGIKLVHIQITYKESQPFGWVAFASGTINHGFPIHFDSFYNHPPPFTAITLIVLLSHGAASIYHLLQLTSSDPPIFFHVHSFPIARLDLFMKKVKPSPHSNLKQVG